MLIIFMNRKDFLRTHEFMNVITTIDEMLDNFVDIESGEYFFPN